MKILIVVGSFKTGGAERMSINTGEELIRRGYDVYFIVQRPIFEIPNTIPQEKIIILRKKDSKNIIYKISTLFIGIYQASRKIKPDTVIAFTRFSSFLSCFTFNKNIIARFDMNPYKLSRKQKIWADFVLNFPLIRKIVVPSTGMLDALQSAKPQFTDKFCVIPNSINKETVLLKASDKIQGYEYDYIAAMGRLSQQKNFELLIRGYSLSGLKEKFKLLIIGDGVLKSKLVELVEKENLSQYVIFTGQLKNPFPILKGAKFFVNTSNHESFCNVILEALTLSKPVIATDCEYGPADMITNYKNGFLIATNEVNELAEKLVELGSNENLIKQYGTNAVASSVRFELNNIGNVWEELIRDTTRIES